MKNMKMICIIIIAVVGLVLYFIPWKAISFEKQKKQLISDFQDKCETYGMECTKVEFKPFAFSSEYYYAYVYIDTKDRWKDATMDEYYQGIYDMQHEFRYLYYPSFEIKLVINFATYTTAWDHSGHQWKTSQDS